MSNVKVHFKAIDSSVSGGSNHNGTAVSIVGRSRIGFQATWSSFDAVDATFKIQSSFDGSNWDDYPASSQTADSAASTKLWDVQLGSAVLYMRVVFTKNSNTAGTFTTSVCLHEEVYNN